MRRMFWGVLIAGAFALPVRAQDESFACERDGVVRKISVVATPDSSRACEVHYERASEGAPAQLLWHAQSDPAYCSARASALVGRLEQAGWSCRSGPTAVHLAPAEPHSVAVAVHGAGITAATRRPAKPAVGARPALQLRPTIH